MHKISALSVDTAVKCFRIFHTSWILKLTKTIWFKTNGNLPITYPLSQKFVTWFFQLTDHFQLSILPVSWVLELFFFFQSCTLDRNPLISPQFVPVACNFNNNKIKNTLVPKLNLSKTCARILKNPWWNFNKDNTNVGNTIQRMFVVNISVPNDLSLL